METYYIPRQHSGNLEPESTGLPPSIVHRYKQSGVIPFRYKKGRIQVLLISNRSGTRWVVPKGMIPKRLDPRTSAAKEAFEEAGILGRVSKRWVGRYVYPKWGGRCLVTVYLMRVKVKLDTWEEMDRERIWVSPGKARRMVAEKGLKKLMARVPHLVVSDAIVLKKVKGFEAPKKEQ